MEVNRQEIYEDEEGSAETKCEEGACSDAALLDDSRGNRGILSFPELDADESDDQNAENDKESDDPAITPRILLTAPLKGEKEADDGWEEDHCSKRVELLQPFGETNRGFLLSFRRLEEYRNDDEGNQANGQVDIKAPPSNRT